MKNWKKIWKMAAQSGSKIINFPRLLFSLILALEILIVGQVLELISTFDLKCKKTREEEETLCKWKKDKIRDWHLLN